MAKEHLVRRFKDQSALETRGGKGKPKAVLTVKLKGVETIPVEETDLQIRETTITINITPSLPSEENEGDKASQ